MAENEVSLKVGADILGALKRLEEFEKKANDSTKNVEKSFIDLDTVVKGALGIFAGKQIIDFFAGGIEAAKAQETAMNAVATALKQTGEFSDEALQSFADFGDEMEKNSKFGDDVIISQAAVAKSFGLTNDQAKDLTRAAVELTTKGYDLDAAVKILGKTYSGSTGKLGAQLPVLKTLTEAQLKNGAAVEEILKAYGGSAAEAMNTFEGAQIQAANASGNFAEAIGDTIVKSPAVVAAIQAVGKGFNLLEDAVKENRPAIDAFVDGLVQGMAYAIPIVTGAIKGVVVAVETFIAAMGMAVTGLLDFGSFATEILGGAVEDGLGGLLDTLETVITALGELPGASYVFDSLGVSASEAAGAVSGIRDSITGLATEGATGIANLRDKTGQWTADFVHGTESFDAGLDKVLDGFDGLAAGVASTDTSMRSLGTSGSAALGTIEKGSGASAEAMKKLRDEATKFLEKTSTSALSELEKIQAERDNDLNKLRDYYAKGVVSSEEFAAARAQLYTEASNKITAIQEKEDAAYRDSLTKRRAELEASISGAASNPFSLAIGKFEISPEARKSLDNFGKENGSAVGAALGGIDKALGGKNGAKDLLASGVGAFADTMLPGVGGVVSSVFGKLAEGPEATKSFIKDFVKGIPEIITNVAESMPVVVEALVDSLINEGGLIKIAMALLKAFSGEAVFKSLGKQLGINAGDSLNAQKIGPKIGDAFKKTLPDFKGIFKGSFDAAVEPIKKLFKGDIKGALKAAIEGPIKVLRASLPEALRKPFDDILGKLRAIGPGIGNSLSSAIKAGLPNFGEMFRAGANQFIEPVRALFRGDIQGALKSAILGPFEAVKASLPAAIQAPFTRFQEALSSAFDRFVPNIGTSITGGFSASFEPLKQLFSGDIAGALKSAITQPFDQIRSSLPEALKEPFDKLTAPIREFATKVGKLVDFKFPSLPTFKWPSIPTPPFIQKFEDAVNKLVGFQLPGTGGSSKSSNPFSGLPKFATGGVVPSGYGNDGYVARLTSKERVLTPQQNAGFERLVEDGPTVGGEEVMGVLLQILAALKEPQQVSTSAKVDGRAFADIMLTLSRRNARVAG